MVVRITHVRYILYVRGVPTVPTRSLGVAASSLGHVLWNGPGKSGFLVVLLVRALANNLRLYVRARARGGNPWSSMSETIVYSGPVDDR